MAGSLDWRHVATFNVRADLCRRPFAFTCQASPIVPDAGQFIRLTHTLALSVGCAYSLGHILQCSGTHGTYMFSSSFSISLRIFFSFSVLAYICFKDKCAHGCFLMVTYWVSLYKGFSQSPVQNVINICVSQSSHNPPNNSTSSRPQSSQRCSVILYQLRTPI